MAEKLTPQQELAVTNRGGKLLVSAAAGSGKTKVLVDRLLSYIQDPYTPANIDDFLIITYTKAAAAELRSKIAAKLTQRIAEEPGNRHLQQQLQRLYLTNISTVHSFCSDVLRQYAYRLDIPADFRVADENECIELQANVLQKILDDAYSGIHESQELRTFIDSQGFGRDDRQIPEIILKVYNSARCHLDPQKWLNWCISIADGSGITDISQTVWGEYLIKDLHTYLDMAINVFERCALMISRCENMEKPLQILESTLDQFRILRSAKTWDDICCHVDIDYGRLIFSKKCTDLNLIEQIKAVRTACKKGLAKRLRRFSSDSAQLLLELKDCRSAVNGLAVLVDSFSAAYDRIKRSRRVMDFGDLEHKMLDLLLGKSRSGPTNIAFEIGQRFREVMVDEYQDSNEVQDAIFSALTDKKQNCFMVGDVKQSIYQFRLADPGIFLKKYNTYLDPAEATPGQGRKVMLSSNFRSSSAVINAVNDVFSTCMSPLVGGLQYGVEEALHEGIPHIQLDEQEIELHGIDVQTDTYAEEASFVAQRIQQLLDGTHMVRQGDILRPIVPEDIVILLRSPGSVGGEFQFALEQKGIRCTTGAGLDLLKTEEIETLRAILQIISNPLQDIPLIATLLSRVFGFTADDMAEIRSDHQLGSFYSAMQCSENSKVRSFLDTLTALRHEARMLGISQLIAKIFSLTRMDSMFAALPDGDIRVENLQSFCQIAAGYEAVATNGLEQFLDYLDRMEQKGLTVPGESNASPAVTIMSIHKSKGLEFPVVFLCGLSREFNMESARAQVLCDKELGLGLSCVDTAKRIRYPSIAKHAISAKIAADSLSEEMRVLYVAMTRAKDRLIMTYALKNLESEIEDISLQMEICDPLMVSLGADCPGLWVLMTAIQHRDKGWNIRRSIASESTDAALDYQDECLQIPEKVIHRLKESLAFQYIHESATKVPSKQTATQLKGREKDREAAENTDTVNNFYRSWRRPSFVENERQGGKEYGNAIHAVLHYIRYQACIDLLGVRNEIHRLLTEGYISEQQAASVDVESLLAFFKTGIGEKLRNSSRVLREFKFSILCDAADYYTDVNNEKILLQGVVDCALVDPDGITVIDFKTDYVTKETVDAIAQRYKMQLHIYAQALERIYQLPIKSALLYFFGINDFVRVE